MNIKYRPELDGVRAIAIIFIILSHFKELNFASGGVNIFFVVSGYLITHILMNQQIDILKFYKSRFFKLYPKIFIVSLITFFIFLFFGDLSQFQSILSSFHTTISSLFNFYLIKVGDVYGLENDINPFLPFWAFCVIIQFYLVFPIILKALFYLKNKLNFDENFFLIILILIATSLYFTYFYFRENTIFSFYSPFSRYWQFIFGSCVYFLIFFKKKLFLDDVTVYFGIFIIIIWQLNFEWFHSWRKTQLLLTLSTLLFLYSTKKNIFNQFLSFKPLRNIGKVSYELYLTHMMIIYFITLWFDRGVFIISILILIISAYIFFKLQNQNLFEKLLYSSKNKLFLYFFSFLIFFTGVFNILNKEDFSKINLISKKNLEYEIIYGNTYKKSQRLLIGNDGQICFMRKFDQNYLDNCSFKKNKNKNFFLIGGSQISTLGYDLKDRLINYNYTHFSWDSFIYLPDFLRIDIENNKTDDYFDKYNSIIRDILLSVDKKSIVLIGARFPVFINNSYFNNDEGGIEKGQWHTTFEHFEDENYDWQDGFKDSIENLLLNENISVILIYPIPEVGFDVNIRLKNYKFFNNNLLDTSYDVFKERTKSTFELLDSIEGENIFRVYPHKLFCDTEVKNRCITYNDNSIFYSDDNHPSIRGAELINNLIMQKLELIEKN